MVLIHHLKSAKYLQPSYPSPGYMSWSGNTAPIFLVACLYCEVSDYGHSSLIHGTNLPNVRIFSYNQTTVIEPHINRQLIVWFSCGRFHNFALMTPHIESTDNN
jgi:hypothetical protein